MTAIAWSKAEFEAQLREKGRGYHIHHPFNVMLNSGAARREQIRGWVYMEIGRASCRERV